ncbi:glutaminyl-peptide cyclotransferase [Pseudonocardia sp. HH130630-07]|uniref:glutaminyl-peptide cyclotransferase n=1 Tax=Pseudonocardia sp. HH130630-07 TaxID=1690815 RepID=UPI000814FCFB|nr:glutaminyl-peptide cyclotransferase [Pseudonocardia sp. HH130630-07]ANY07230.1 glutaminyl-peptide cyclotransferase [Pseudonocardia sp. HH130630-07]
MPVRSAPARRPAGLLVPLVLVLVACGATVPAQRATADPGAVPVVAPQVLGEIPHDPEAFTQGLELRDGTLYEGTGRVGESELRALDPDTGAVRSASPLPEAYFGEGITVVGDRIWQLTWTDGVAVERDRATLEPLREVAVDGEGWGLCQSAPDRVVRSDGTDTLHFHDPADLAPTGSVAVTLDGSPLGELNELECVGNRVWANVWKTDRIVRIDPATGVVDAVVDAAGLLPADRRAGADVLNGIAHVSGDEYLLTGKLWPTTFRVRLPVPAA